MTCSNPLVSGITVQDFKDLFFRDFSYLPVWSALKTYNQDQVVYYAVTELFYICSNNGITSVPTTTADWSIIQGNINDYILDADIEKAFDEACIVFNASLFSNANAVKMGWLYLTAHFVVYDVNAGGLETTGQQRVNSRAVGNVSEAYTIPEWMLSNPIYSFLTVTSYGAKYLNMILPFLIGNIGSVWGGTNA